MGFDSANYRKKGVPSQSPFLVMAFGVAAGGKRFGGPELNVGATLQVYLAFPGTVPTAFSALSPFSQPQPGQTFIKFTVAPNPKNRPVDA